MKLSPILPAVLVPALLAAACGTAEGPKQESAQHVPARVEVSIKQMKFDPDTVHVQRGDTVVWTNNDVVDHDVTALPDSAWQSPLLHPGDQWKHVMEKDGDYFCSIHVVMRGKLMMH